MSQGDAQARQTLQRMRNEIQAMMSKITELDSQKDEHNLVLQALEKLEPTRRCYRSIGGVLVERTAGEVIPAVTANRDNLIQVVATLKQQLDERQKIMTDFALEHGLAQIDKSEEKKEKQQPAKAAQGVLV